MNLKELREIIMLMNDNQLTEIELERDGTKIKLKKGMTGVVSEMVTHHMPMASPASGAGSAPMMPPPVLPVVPAALGIEIKAPMVGTFYRSPSPDSPPFVEVGQEIEVGQVVCIIEAMKLMNEIKSEVKGTITKMCVDNAEPVEFGELLFLVEPAV